MTPHHTTARRTTLRRLAAGLPILALALAPAAFAAPLVEADAPAVSPEPVVLFEEGFENGTAATPLSLTTYTGAQGTTYTADTPWTVACNGIILQWSSPDSDLPRTGCNLKQASSNLHAYERLRQLAWALGSHDGATDPEGNHVVSAYTDGANPGADRVQLRSSPISLPESLADRYLTFSVDTAALNCHVSGPRYNFFLEAANGVEEQIGTTVDTCALIDQTVTAPSPRPTGSTVDVSVGTFYGNGAFQHPGGDIRVVVRNANGSGAGNDAALDNLRIVDVTPHLRKDFSTTLLGTGQETRLTFTIDNTADLAAKRGLRFTDTLVRGLQLADDPAFESTCADATFQLTRPGGRDALAFTGDLDAGAASCTFSVDVTSEEEGTYANGSDNIDETNIVPPREPAEVRFADPRLEVVKQLDGHRGNADDQFTVQATDADGDAIPAVGDPTTRGTGEGIVDGSGTTGSLRLLADASYGLDEVGAGATDLARYEAAVTCDDRADEATNLPEEVTLSEVGTFELPAGADVRCAITNRALPQPEPEPSPDPEPSPQPEPTPPDPDDRGSGQDADQSLGTLPSAGSPIGLLGIVVAVALLGAGASTVWRSRKG